MLRKYGKLRTVVHTEVGAYDATTGKNAVTQTTFQVPMVTFPYEIKFINNTTIKMTDLWGLFSAQALTVVPQPGDKLTIDGVVFTFERVQPMSPGGVAVYYECHLSQG
jgi:hypothetical protein